MLLLLVLSFGANKIVVAQHNVLDSLNDYLSSAKDDSNKIRCLQSLFFELEFEDVDLAEKYIKEALALAKKIDYKSGIAHTYICLGYLAEDKGDFSLALEQYNHSYFSYLNMENKKGQSKSLRNISGVYSSIGQYPKALEYCLRSLKISEELKDLNAIAFDYTILGGIYHGMEDYNKALDYFLKSLKISEKIGDRSGLANDLGNVGVAYKELNNFNKALEYYSKSLEVATEFNVAKPILIAYINMGAVYEGKKMHNQALDYYRRAKQKAIELADKNTLSIVLCNMGSVNISLKKYKEAETNLLDAYSLAMEIGSISTEKMVHEFLSDLYEETNRFEKAHYHFKAYSYLKDTIFSEDKLEDMTRQELTYEFDKKEAFLIAEQDKKLAITEVEKKRNRMFIGFLASILLAVLVITLLVFRTLKLTRKQKQIIENQKELVEEKQKEILDSIRYAKRIQEALLTSQSYINRNIKRLKNL